MEWRIEGQGSEQEVDPTIWVYPKENQELKEKIIQEFKLHPILAQILVSRNFTSMEEIHHFLYAKLPDLHDPFSFAEMPQAVERILRAIRNGENILIYGDNDVDGMTGTALLYEFLHFTGAHVFHYISARSILRQSMILDALEYALTNYCTLLITVDCGITAAAEIEQVIRHKIDVIVTDHHEPTNKIAHCVATLNPKLVSSTYPNRELTGVGVAFKLAHALTNYFVEEGYIPPKKVDLKRYLDLVALGTVADMGLLVGENRVLVRYGLDQLRRTKRVGLSKLAFTCDVDLATIASSTIASKIAPQLNSLGRVADPQKGVKLLLVRNALAAEKLAQELNLHNIERQRIEKTMANDVGAQLTQAQEIFENKAIVMASPKWHPGIIAILATRVSKQFNRPTVMIAIEGQIGKGSIRSIPEFPILPALKELSDILLNYGGHDYAAGLTIREQYIEEFTSRFIDYANCHLQDYQITPKVYLNAQAQFVDLTFDFMESFRLLEPYGNGNQQPILYTVAKQVALPRVVGKQHLKLYLEQGGDRMLEGLGIGLASQVRLLQKKNMNVRIAFTPQVNEFQNKSSIQLLIKAFQPLES